MQSQFVSLLRNGSDLLLDSTPIYDVNRENYKSAIEEAEAVASMIKEQSDSGVLEYPADGVLPCARANC